MRPCVCCHRQRREQVPVCLCLCKEQKHGPRHHCYSTHSSWQTAISEKTPPHNEMWSIISRVGTRQFQNPLSDVGFFSPSLSAFHHVFVLSIFPLAPPRLSLSIYQTLFPWHGCPSALQGARDQWDALYSHYFSLTEEKNNRMHKGLFFLTSFIKIWYYCYALPGLRWTLRGCGSSHVGAYVQYGRTKAYLNNPFTHYVDAHAVYGSSTWKIKSVAARFKVCLFGFRDGP